MLELKIKEGATFPEAVEFNFEELKIEIEKIAKLYKGIVVTEETTKSAKNDRAKINKFISALNDKRKEVKQKYLEPYQDFESKIQVLIGIVEEPKKIIDEQIKHFEELEKEQKRKDIEQIFIDVTTTEIPDVDFLKLETIFNIKWLNKSVSLSSIADDLVSTMKKIKNDIVAINNLGDFSFEAMEVYKNTLDLSRAIAEGNRLADIQRRKLEAEARAKKEAEEKKPEVEAKKTDEMPIKAEELQTEALEETKSERSWIKCQLYMTVKEAHELKYFCDARGIEIKQL